MDFKDAQYLLDLVESGKIVLCRYEPDNFCSVIGVDLSNMTVEMVPGDAEYENGSETITVSLGSAARSTFLLASSIDWSPT